MNLSCVFRFVETDFPFKYVDIVPTEKVAEVIEGELKELDEEEREGARGTYFSFKLDPVTAERVLEARKIMKGIEDHTVEDWFEFFVLTAELFKEEGESSLIELTKTTWKSLRRDV